MYQHKVIVIGTSTGGVQALSKLVSNLPANLPAAIFIVCHIPPTYHSALPHLLSRAGVLLSVHPEDGELIESSKIYVAPPDRHLLVETSQIRVSKGPKEHKFRPAIDPLFRSAAYAFGSNAIGIVLTGALDDGTAGLWAIKDRGGIAIVQDPQEAEQSSMPINAMQNVKVDYCLLLSEIPQLLVELTKESTSKKGDASLLDELNKEKQLALQTEINVALEANSSDLNIAQLGEPSLYTCPDCHGTLIKIKKENLTNYRCHTGHAFSLKSLLAVLDESIEDSLWTVLRETQEGIVMLKEMIENATKTNQMEVVHLLTSQAEEMEKRANFIRHALMIKGSKSANAG